MPKKCIECGARMKPYKQVYIQSPSAGDLLTYRCEECGKVSEEMKECCGQKMADLTSSKCMACQGCGHH